MTIRGEEISTGKINDNPGRRDFDGENKSPDSEGRRGFDGKNKWPDSPGRRDFDGENKWPDSEGRRGFDGENKWPDSSGRIDFDGENKWPDSEGRKDFEGQDFSIPCCGCVGVFQEASVHTNGWQFGVLLVTGGRGGVMYESILRSLKVRMDGVCVCGGGYGIWRSISATLGCVCGGGYRKESWIFRS